jgi:hypothetical protein
MTWCEKREELSVEELGVEGLGGDGWPLQDFLGDDDDGRTGERMWTLLHDDCAVGGVKNVQVRNQLVEEL